MIKRNFWLKSESTDSNEHEPYYESDDDDEFPTEEEFGELLESSDESD